MEPLMSRASAEEHVREYLKNDHHAVMFFDWEIKIPYSHEENDQVVREFVNYLVRMGLVAP